MINIRLVWSLNAYFLDGFLIVDVSSSKGNCFYEIDSEISFRAARMSNIREDSFFCQQNFVTVRSSSMFCHSAGGKQGRKGFAHPQGYIRTSLLEHFFSFLLETWKASYVMSFLSSRFFFSFILFSVTVSPHFLTPASPPNIFFQDCESACAPCAIFRTRLFFFILYFFLNKKPSTLGWFLFVFWYRFSVLLCIETNTHR